jgi:RNA polymerase subunit RPABC4/transcription elongation factor Spt4
MLCPVCKNNWDENTTQCPICGHDLTAEEDQDEWLIIGDIDDKISADFARETLTSHDIPTVIFSRSGFFGDVGLPLHPFYKPGGGIYDIAVPSRLQEEAVEILDIILGDHWHRKEK